jgi:hypothetical protein
MSNCIDGRKHQRKKREWKFERGRGAGGDGEFERKTNDLVI